MSHALFHVALIFKVLSFVDFFKPILFIFLILSILYYNLYNLYLVHSIEWAKTSVQFFMLVEGCGAKYYLFGCRNHKIFKYIFKII